MKKLTFLSLVIIVTLSLLSDLKAAPGDYTLRIKGGPSFGINDYENQLKFGFEFDYDLGFGWGVGMEALLGVMDDVHFQLVPHARFTWLYIGPAELFIIAGAGFETFDRDVAFTLRTGPGIVLPLGNKYEIMSDFTFNLTPVGTPGTPIILDWLIGFGFKFGGG